jgi:hypothetical protein
LTDAVLNENDKGTMTQKTKRFSLLLLFGTLVSLILLSASLSNLQLRAGTPFPSGGKPGSGSQGFMDLMPANTDSFILLKGIFSLVLLALMIYVSVRLISLITLKKILHLLFFLTGLLLLIILVSYIPLEWTPYNASDASGIATPYSVDYSVSPLGEPPQALVWLVTIGFVFGAGLLIIKLLKPWLYPTRIEEQVLQEAESAVNAIKAGENLRNVILRCYLQMTHILQEERRIERTYNMTVREFENWLKLEGFPSTPVQQLTRLFEKVRYDKQQTTDSDEKIATESLNEIIQFCRGEKDR